MPRRRKSNNLQLLQVLEAHEHALQIVAYEIHDGFTQQATAAMQHMEAFRNNAIGDKAVDWKEYDSAMELLKLGIIESRRLMDELRPPLFNHFDLKKEIDGLILASRAENGPKVKMHWQVISDSLSRRLAHSVFRIVQECLTNSRKHSKSDRVQIQIVQEDHRLFLHVEDWGIGFDSDQIGPDCFGLEGIRLRAKSLGGNATIISTPGRGTRISAEFPIAG